MSKVDERIGAVDLYSQTRPLAREEIIKLQKWFREMCVYHVKLFGAPVAMYLLWKQPLPRGDHRVALHRKANLFAKTVDGVTVSRRFCSAKYADGQCYCCRGKRCLLEGCALTRWGTGWSRFECWAEEMRWIDSHEFHRRERLTDAWWATGDRDLVRRSSNGNRFLEWQSIEGVLLEQETRRATGGATAYVISKDVAAGESESVSLYGVARTMQYAQEHIVNERCVVAPTADELRQAGDWVGPRIEISYYLETILRGVTVTRLYTVGAPDMDLHRDVSDGGVVRICATEGLVKARGEWYRFVCEGTIPTPAENTSVIEISSEVPRHWRL